MAAELKDIIPFLTSPDWTEGEKTIIEWRFDMIDPGSFKGRLMSTISHADLWNLNKLKKGFPELVDAYMHFTHGDLGTRLREAGLKI